MNHHLDTLIRTHITAQEEAEINSPLLAKLRSEVSELMESEAMTTCITYQHDWMLFMEKWICLNCFVVAKSDNLLIEPCVECGDCVDAHATHCEACTDEVPVIEL